jgi:putative membrane-bound dehydrogenase-like protein
MSVRTGCSGLGVGCVIVAAAAFLSAGGQSPSTELGLTVPPGFEIERVAGPPLVNRPIVAAFDEEGRLYVADSSGSNDKVEKQLADKPHRIVRLEDTDGDGRFDKSVVFADRVMFPEGTMWHDGSLYVAAPPSIWKLTDKDGDGVADQREEWFQGKTLTSCANDLHGPYLGPDGWIYWTKGAFAEQTYERPGQTPFITSAAHIFRRRPDDRLVEPVMTGGMDNPVDVAFTPTGERILTATFLEHPQLGRRDALIHAVYGGVYGKPHRVIDGHKRTGDLMPALSQFGPAAPAGLTRYASRVFGDEYQDNFFAVLFNMHKVTRHVLEPSGATFKSIDSDFVISNSPDFHPTDVLEDADGSLLVVDTGGWYKLCCPTSQLAKPDVLGAIYRVRRLGVPAVVDPRGLKLAWNTMNPAELVRLLDDPKPFVRNRAIDRLAAIGRSAVSALAGVLERSSSSDARLNAIWSLTRIGPGPATEAARLALTDRDEAVQQSAIHGVGLWRDRAAVPALIKALESGAPAVQRAAAEALGRIGDSRAVPVLLATATSPLDRVLEHSVSYALIEIGDWRASATGLQSSSSHAKRVALIAVDQMDHGGLQPKQVISLLESPDPVLKETAWWIADHHPEWGSDLADFFQERLGAPNLTAPELNDLQLKLAQFSESPAIQNLLATTANRAMSTESRAIVLAAMAKARVKTLPASWVAPINRALESPDGELTEHAIGVLRATAVPDESTSQISAALLRVAHDASRPDGLRLSALSAIPGGLTSVDPALFDLLRANLQPSSSASLRALAATVVEKARLERNQLVALTEVVKTAGPLELPRLLPAFDNAGDETLGLALISAMKESSGKSAVRADVLRPRLAKYPLSVQRQGEVLLASLRVDSAAQAQRLEELLATVQGGDVRRGQAVFNSPKVGCMSCHTVGYVGGRVGPDLTRIGQIRSERDLLEAIVFPSASFARGYEPVVVTTTSGEVRGGVLRSDLLDEMVLVSSTGEESRILRKDIADVQPGTVSLMPPGLADQLTRQEVADLLAFLKDTRSGAH